MNLAYERRTAAAVDGLVALPGKWVRWVDFAHVGELVDAAAAHADDADVVMVGECRGLPARPEDFGPEWPWVARALAEGYRVEWRGDPWQLMVRSPNLAGGWRRVILLPYDTAGFAGPWDECRSLPDLTLALSRFAHTTGLAWRGSIGRTAEALILSTHPRERGGVLLDTNPVVPPPALDGALGQPFTWRRPFGDWERPSEGARWVHHVDLNAAYLSAWQSVELGIGEPEHYPAGVEYSAKRAGLWRLELPVVDPQLLPAPWLPGRDWFTTPTLTRVAEVLGELPRVAEAWVWPNHSRYLRGAAERLRDARAQLLDDAGDGARIALDAVKSLYRVETGRFNMAARDERSPWHRPDWGHFVRDQARANLHRRLSKLAVTPFAITTDDLLFVSPEAEASTFAASIGLPWGDGLGQFKAKATVELTPALAGELAEANATGCMRAMRAAAKVGA